jgi:DNA-binding XRE family transcriptional regulator
MAARKIQGRVLNRKEVKIAMIRQDLTPTDLAKALSISKMTMNARIQGRTRCRMLEVERLVEVLKVDFDLITMPEGTEPIE